MSVIRRKPAETKGVEPAQTAPGGVQFNCLVCNTSEPGTGRGHVCSFRDKQSESLARRQRQQNAARRANEAAPLPCPDCGRTFAVGASHACPGPAGPPNPNMAEQLAEQLRAAGYKVEPAQ